MDTNKDPIPPAPANASEKIETEVLLPGIGGEVKIAMLSLSFLETRLTRELGATYPKDKPLETYVQDCGASLMFLLAQMPKPAYEIPVLISMLRLTINALLDFAAAIQIVDAPVPAEPGKPKSSIPLDDSLEPA